ncbi:polysaccharide biosynthesis protein [Aquiluna sp.]|nr:polysaccharide biosynthesis protein [Aquiluna sp.]
MASELDGDTVLITGGTGSFGRTIVQSLLQDNLAEIRVFSRDEAKQDAMRAELGSDRVSFHLGDTRDLETVRRAVKGVDLVFHAAALKQVPSGEFFPMETVKTNILGSNNVVNASIEAEVKRVVCLSTDKAVYPINAMGMTKALMEKNTVAIARGSRDSKTRLAITRYGNVMMSRGSVIPKFIQQAKEHKPLTLTSPGMTRFLMSLDESVELVKFAFQEALTGDLFVKKAPGALVKDLAQAVKEIYNSESEIVNIGMRHGEKMHEALLSSEEASLAKDLGDFYRVSMDVRGLNYEVFFDSGHVAKPRQPYTSENTERLSVEEIKKLLLGLPEIEFDLGLSPK